jgi:hypothetical protein
MKEITNSNICERADDLVAFLYGELSEIDARRFERHLHQCAACETEFATFGQIRESIVAWRDESLGVLRSSEIPESAVVSELVGRPEVHVKSSALAALREFFNLSPMWLKGATALASVLFCVCAALAIAYLRNGPSPIVRMDNGKIYGAEDFKKEVAKQVQEQLDAAQSKKEPQNEIVIAVPNALNQAPKRVNQSRSTDPIARNPRRPFTRRESQELATDLRLVTARDDDDVDLTGDSNRPTP